MTVIIRLTLALITCILIGAGIMYNKVIIEKFIKAKENSNSKFMKKIVNKLERVNKNSERQAHVKRSGLKYKFYNYLLSIIEGLDLVKDQVTPLGLTIFISTIGLAGALVLTIVMNSIVMIVPAFFSVSYLVLVLFRFSALMRYEKREAQIMDAEDLLVADIKRGVYNSITRYKNSLHPDIQPYFKAFLDDISVKGYSFNQAMYNLNAKLGSSFNSFAQKAILYENKADETMSDIFTEIIETNRAKRNIRYINNQIFNQLRTELILSMVIICGYCLFSASIDQFIRNFFLNTTLGKLLVLGDIILIAGVLAYQSALKANSLK